MDATNNKKLMQEIFSELSKGNSLPLIENMADDCSWTVKGMTTWSRNYSDKRSILNDLFAALRSRLVGQYSNTAHRFIAEGDLVMVEGTGHSTTTSGVPYNNEYCFVFRLSGGKLQTVTEYGDTELVAKVLGDREAALI